MRVVTDLSTGAILLDVVLISRSLRQVNYAQNCRSRSHHFRADDASRRAGNNHGRPRLSALMPRDPAR